MLGSQRTTVNEAAQTLQRAGAITYSRGKIRIIDRAALERIACECYKARGLASSHRA
jgi:DNA-binding transcriptional regulator YhcF (GntR family)